MTTFRASARAVDMLGRQQIAGIPTAISELFKNAHDAYADRVAVDFLRWDDTFVLRDDGIGMSPEDFEERWLTLGTESKLGSAALEPPPIMPGKKKRPLLGEKGIGRLAIAAIGPQVLVLTRAFTQNGSAPVVCAFINWSLFAVPGVRLDSVEIPIAITEAGSLPTQRDIQAMVDEVRATGAALLPTGQDAKALAAQLDAFHEIDPLALDATLDEPSLRSGHGTHFVITPVDDSLIPAIAEPDDRFRTSPLRKALVGFTNVLAADSERSIAVAFRDHRTRDAFDELIADDSFFAPEEFIEADHHIEGVFDQFGQFRGTVTVYGTEPTDHVVPWPPAAGKRTECGPFAIRVAIVQGERRNSLIPGDEWARLTAKLDKIGGLYVYRDGIRVLPYGDSDFDWVNIEFRRTKGASYYYFSYRRMFGYVDITSAKNASLVEKAGREGFRENTAYRQLRQILENFFVQIAAEFFREGATRATTFDEVREDLERKEKLRQARERRARVRRAEFENGLAATGKAILDGDVDSRVEAIVDALGTDLEAATLREAPEDVAADFLSAERRARGALADVREQYGIRAPRGFALTRALRRDWEGHREEWAQLEARTLQPALELIEGLVNTAAQEHHVAVDRRRRFEQAVEMSVEEARRATRDGERAASEALGDVRQRVDSLRRQSAMDLERLIAEIGAEIARVDVTQLSDEDFVAERSILEDRLVELAERERDTLLSVAEQLRAVRWSEDDEEASAMELAVALEDEVLALRERSDEDLELAQLGMAVGVINHEFDASIRAVRSSLRRLKSWADINEPLAGLYQNLRTSFDHLDGYLSMFTPLQRRLYRTRVEIAGAEIETFLRDLFERRLDRHSVKMGSSPAFRRHRIYGYPSTFYPVFVNLVDNAVFWLASAPEPREIYFDVEKDTMLIEDSGPGVAAKDREVVFERGFTRRPGGQGLGLYISREILMREGYSLELGAGKLSGAVFAIAPQGEGSETQES